MSSSVVTFRFPNGDTEYRLGDPTAPLAGELLRRGDDVWLVEQVAQGNDGSALVTLARVAPPDAAPPRATSRR